MLVIVSLAAIVIAYLLGSLPTGYLVTRRAKHADIRDLGDRYTGAKNVYREVGLAAAVLTVVGDVAKGALTMLIALVLGVPEPVLILVGLTVVAGHIWPVFLQFRGGAGLATAIGVVMVVLPREALALVPLFAILVWLLRKIGLGLTAVILLPLLMLLSWFLNEDWTRIVLPVVIGTFVAARVYGEQVRALAGRVFGHRPNTL